MKKPPLPVFRYLEDGEMLQKGDGFLKGNKFIQLNTWEEYIPNQKKDFITLRPLPRRKK